MDNINNFLYPFLSKPFVNSGKSKIESLETISDLEKHDGKDQTVTAGNDRENVIEEREGVPYISGETLKPNKEKTGTLDKDFKDLVDSVIK